MRLEKMIEDAIVAKFFEPSWIMTTQAIYGQNGQIIGSELVAHQAPSPMSNVAKAVYDSCKDQIIARVLEKIDIDEMVDEWGVHIAKDVVAKLEEKPGWNAAPGSSAREKMLNKVYDQVAEEFGKQCVAHLKQTGGLMNILEAGSGE